MVLSQTDGEIREYIPEFRHQSLLNPRDHRPLALIMTYIHQNQSILGCIKVVVLEVRGDVNICIPAQCSRSEEGTSPAAQGYPPDGGTHECAVPERMASERVFDVVEEGLHRHFRRELPDSPRTDVGMRVCQREDLVGDLFVRMAGAQGLEDDRELPAVDHGFEPDFLHPIEVSGGTQGRLGAGQRPEATRSAQLKSASVVAAQLAGSSIEKRCLHSRYGIGGHEDHELYHEIGLGIEGLQGRGDQSQPLGEGRVYAIGDVVEVGVRRVNGDALADGEFDRALDGVLTGQPLEALKDDRVVDDDHLAFKSHRFLDQGFIAVQTHHHPPHRRVRVAHQQPRVVIRFLQKGGRPALHGTGDVPDGGEFGCILHAANVPPRTMRIPRDARAWGLPLALLYGGVVRLRNWAYDRGLLASRPGALRTLVLGNVTVGGTGKTPHAIFMVRALEGIVGEGRVGLLSRGYGRRTRGFRWVRAEDDAATVGDEPLLIKRHLGEVPVAVCGDRLAGLASMHSQAPQLRWVVLDDALQHRRLRPDLALILLDDTQPVEHDFYLPTGRLRDTPRSLRRADAALLTRLPSDASPARLASALTYQGWPADRPHWGTTMRMRFPGLPQVRPRAVAVAGIAQPHRFLDALPGPFQVVASFTYPDHHPYTAQDALRWAQAAQQHHAQYLVTTEKDAVRMAQWAPGYHPLILLTVGLEIEFFQPQDFLQWLREKVRQREAGTR